jgi:hypothetical protein
VREWWADHALLIGIVIVVGAEVAAAFLPIWI